MSDGWKTTGTTASQMLARLSGLVDTLEEEAFDMVEQTVAEAADLQRLNLENAHTPTGISRATGGHIDPYGSTAPGRISSGEMIDAIRDKTVRDDNTMIGEWGWPQASQSQKIREQEGGTNRIEAADSLIDSFIATREIFFDRATKITKGQDWRS